MVFRAVTIRSAVAYLGSRWKYSAHADRTAGAICTTVMRSGSASASKTLPVSSCSCKPPTGQWVMHWPQNVQSLSPSVRVRATPTVVWEPVPIRSQMPMVCTLSQIWIQRIHLTQRFSMRTTGLEKSGGAFRRSSM